MVNRDDDEPRNRQTDNREDSDTAKHARPDERSTDCWTQRTSGRHGRLRVANPFVGSE